MSSTCLSCLTIVAFTLIDCIAATLGVDYIFHSVPLSRSALWEARLLWYILACMYLLVINLLEVETLWQEVSYAALNAPAIHPASYIDSRAKLLILIIFTSLVAEMQAIMLVHRALKKTLVSSRRNPKSHILETRSAGRRRNHHNTVPLEALLRGHLDLVQAKYRTWPRRRSTCQREYVHGILRHVLGTDHHCYPWCIRHDREPHWRHRDFCPRIGLAGNETSVVARLPWTGFPLSGKRADC